MRIYWIAIALSATVAAPFDGFSACGQEPAAPLPGTSAPTAPLPATPPPAKDQDQGQAEDEFDDTAAPYMMPWAPLPKPPLDSGEQTPGPKASAVYAMIWRPECEQQMGLSLEQTAAILAIDAKGYAEVERQAKRNATLPPDAWKTPEFQNSQGQWRRRLDDDIRKQIEAVLTPGQLQTLQDFSFRECALGLLFKAEVRKSIDFTEKQADDLRRLYEQRTARFQKEHLQQRDKIWALLDARQREAMPEVVRHQGPTSAVLSLAFDVNCDFAAMEMSRPMFGEAPVRERLELTAEQQERFTAIRAEATLRSKKHRQEAARLRSGKAAPASPEAEQERGENDPIETLLTPQQLALLDEIDFRREVELALAYPEKREKIGMTEQQYAALQQLDRETADRLYSIDQELIGQALGILSPRQREQMRAEVNRRGCRRAE